MRAASEHPRIATAIATALIMLALAGVGVSRALGGAQHIRTSEGTLRVGDRQVTGLLQQLHAAEAQRAQLRGQVATLTAELARAPRSQQRAQTNTHVRARSPKR